MLVGQKFRGSAWYTSSKNSCAVSCGKSGVVPLLVELLPSSCLENLQKWQWQACRAFLVSSWLLLTDVDLFSGQLEDFFARGWMLSDGRPSFLAFWKSPLGVFLSSFIFFRAFSCLALFLWCLFGFGCLVPYTSHQSSHRFLHSGLCFLSGLLARRKVSRAYKKNCCNWRNHLLM